MENAKKKITLYIANSRIDIVTDEDAEYVRKLSGIISQKVSAMTLSRTNVTKTDAALIYALELLDENFKLKMELEELKKQNNG